MVQSVSPKQVQGSTKPHYPSGKRHIASVKLLYASVESRAASISTWSWSSKYQFNIMLQIQFGLKRPHHQFYTSVLHLLSFKSGYHSAASTDNSSFLICLLQGPENLQLYGKTKSMALKAALQLNDTIFSTYLTFQIG